MPSAEFHRELVAKTDRAHTWKILTDVPRIAGWVTIVSDATEISPLECYSAVLTDRIGPFKLKASLDIQLVEVVVEERIRLTATGEDRQVSSRIAVDATMRLISTNTDTTTVVVEGHYEVVGRAASMGAGIIAQKAQKILDEFFDRADAELG